MLYNHLFSFYTNCCYLLNAVIYKDYIVAKIIDGKAIAGHIKQKLKTDADKLKENGIMPGLAVVLVGNNPASLVYVRAKGKACDEVGIASFQHNLPEDIRQEELIELIKKLNADTPHLNEEAVLETILPSKDVDGFHPFNVGRLVTGKPLLQPCTPYGIMKILESEGIEISGKHAVIIGRSNIIGKPAAIMLLQRNATVTICHSKTKDLPHITRQADILIAAVGKPKMVKGDWIKQGAVVIDVGVNRLENGTLVGDVDFEEAKAVSSAITPMPGGVGPMTIAMLLNNTIDAAKRQQQKGIFKGLK